VSASAARGPRASGTPDAGAQSEEPVGLSFGGHVLAFFRELLLVMIGAVIVASLVRALVGQMFVIPSISMEDTLQVSDRVLIEKLSSVKRGQVVVFKDPGGWLNEAAPAERSRIGQALEFVGVLPDLSPEHLIKRVLGVPGDRVGCCDSRGRITVNDQPVDESEYLYTAATQSPVASEIRFDVTVPADRIFVLGDNRGSSRDSRCHLNDPGPVRGENAFVPEDLVVGRAIAVVWPLAGAHRLRTPVALAEAPASGVDGEPDPKVVAGPEATC
jgi:signal peptidase I